MTTPVREIAGTADRGEQVAWTIPPHHNRSVAHRAFDATSTFCSRTIPHDRRIGVSPRLAKCGRCEKMFHRAEQYRATLLQMETKP